jgi:phage repressor protein C with HTH and peptisase S24 domain
MTFTLSRPVFLERVRKTDRTTTSRENIMDKAEYSPELFLQQIETIAKNHGLKFPGGFEKKIGMRGAVSSWEHLDKKGKPKKFSIPSVDTLLKIKNLFKVSVDWLLTGEEPKSKEISQPIITVAGRYPELPPGVHSKNFLFIPQVTGHIAAQHARAIPPSEIENWVCVYLPQEGRRQYNDLLAVQVDRDYHAMEPAIRAEDTVIIDPNDITPVPKGIYAIRSHMGKECSIKRIFKSGKSLVITSDNPDYTPYLLPADEIEKIIIGRVLWSWTGWVG